MTPLVEVVPNFSEGRDAALVDRLSAAVSSPPEVRLLDQTMDPDHHRSVVTAVGPPEAVEDGLLSAARAAVSKIDLGRHQGVHPRIGALDVAPFIPVGGIDWDDLTARARAFGRRLAQELDLPVFFYGRAATAPERNRLEVIRREAFTALSPDCGGPQPHPTAGAVAVGVREFLVAFNIQLATRDLSIARRIARSIRESSGGMPAVKALGLDLPAEGCTQVSMNLVDFRTTPPAAVFARVREQARQADVEIIDSELIGLIPQAALEGTSGKKLRIRNWSPDQMIFERRLALAS